MKRFWKWLCIFSYRRWADPAGTPPLGVPFNRDPEHPCTFYEPRKHEIGDYSKCMGDGHYLCQGCCHLARFEDDSHDRRKIQPTC